MTDTYEVEVDLEHDRDRVWQALVDPADLEVWFCEHADIDVAAGRYDFWGRFTPGVPSREERAHTIIDLEPGRLLRYAWPLRGGDTTVTITLDGDTRVNVVHDDVPARRSGMEHVPSHLWMGALGNLRSYLATGRPGPRFDWSWPHHGGFFAEADVPAATHEVWRALVDDGWLHPENPMRRPARTENEDFAWDVGVLQGVRLLDVTPSERFSLAWIGDHETILTYELADSGGSTHITIVQSGFSADRDIQGMAEGFFSGIAEIGWVFESGGTWRPGGRDSVRVLRNHETVRSSG
jgi:uncharacterized protein YndB with AHSA1/START domain